MSMSHFSRTQDKLDFVVLSDSLSPVESVHSLYDLAYSVTPDVWSTSLRQVRCWASSSHPRIGTCVLVSSCPSPTCTWCCDCAPLSSALRARSLVHCEQQTGPFSLTLRPLSFLSFPGNRFFLEMISILFLKLSALKSLMTQHFHFFLQWLRFWMEGLSWMKFYLGPIDLPLFLVRYLLISRSQILWILQQSSEW